MIDVETGAVPTAVDGAVGRAIVVGAGMSGLVAARALHLAGVETVVVEGRDRIGGRTHTVDVGGVPVDLGGSWIHAGTTSPMLPYVEALGIDRLPAAASTIVSDACIVDRAAGRAGEPDAALDRMTALAMVMLGVHGSDPPPAESNLADAIDHLAPDATPAARRGAGLLLAMYEGAEPSEIGFDTFVALLLEGGSVADTDVLPSGGYRRVVEALADGLDIRCSTNVEAVHQDDGGVTVATSAGPLTGSHVIVTAPLGVLKAGSIGFEPPLPDATATAIDRVGFGVFEKVALEYPTAVWQRDGVPRHLSAVDAVSPEWPTILDMSAWYGAPVVVGLAVGDSARTLAAMTEDEKVASLHAVIATVAGAEIAAPISHAVTSWTNDPFLLGCYTKISLTSTPEQQLADVATLGRPHGRVLFAGEHTDEAGTSSVDSAWRSGLREAARLLRRSTVTL